MNYYVTDDTVRAILSPESRKKYFFFEDNINTIDSAINIFNSLDSFAVKAIGVISNGIFLNKNVPIPILEYNPVTTEYIVDFRSIENHLLELECAAGYETFFYPQEIIDATKQIILQFPDIHFLGEVPSELSNDIYIEKPNNISDIGREMLLFQANLAKDYKYKPIPPMFATEYRRRYQNTLPDFLKIDGDNIPLYSLNGTKICDSYDRIVIGDYGAFIEISPEKAAVANFKIKEGEEYRLNDPHYSNNVKYHWLTAKDNSNCKIYYQQKTVDYADYIPGRYYISPYEIQVEQEKIISPPSVYKELKSEEEKEAFIQGIEAAIDYGELISQNDIQLYNHLIAERTNSSTININEREVTYMSNVKVLVGKIENPTSKKVGYASLVFDDKFVVKNISIYEGEKGLYLRYPGYNAPTKEGAATTYKNYCNPITKDAATMYTKAILNAFNSDLHETTLTLDKPFEYSITAYPNSNTSGQVASAKLYLNNNFVIDKIIIRESKESKMFVSMPSYATNEVDETGKKIYKSHCNPITKDFAQELNSAILDKCTQKSKEIGTPLKNTSLEMDDFIRSDPFKNKNISLEMDDFIRDINMSDYEEELPFN